MSDELMISLLKQILQALERIEWRFSKISGFSEFVASEEGREKLDAICMQLIAVGEGLKKLESIGGNRLFLQHSEIEWKKAMAMRDILSHHYFEVNPEVIYNTRKDVREYLERGKK
ncbi:MAG: DUF86 domain-containing protein [Candidatus Brocadiae bacterium]|nr:DUF86 domain-containing protein [Candidatus Brocadiia bacterium]